MSDGFLNEEDDEESDEDVVDVESEVVESDIDQTTDKGVTKATGETELASPMKPVTEDLTEVAEVFEDFSRVKNELLVADDLQTISGNAFITKSGWRKIASAFGVSTNVTSRDKEISDGVVTYTVTARAEAPNGQAANGVGSCSSNESNFMVTLEKDTKNVSLDEVAEAHAAFDEDDILLVDGAWRGLKRPKEVSNHDLIATAATRAKNRAISDLVGGGQVSAEELDADQFIG